MSILGIGVQSEDSSHPAPFRYSIWMKRMSVTTDRAAAAIGPYVQAVRVGDLVYTSGQLARDPATGELVGATTGEQTAHVLDNLSAVLEAAGSSLALVVKATVFLADMNDFAEMNTVYASYFGDDPPARSAVEVARLPKDARIEIEAVALAEAPPTGGAG